MKLFVCSMMLCAVASSAQADCLSTVADHVLDLVRSQPGSLIDIETGTVGEIYANRGVQTTTITVIEKGVDGEPNYDAVGVGNYAVTVQPTDTNYAKNAISETCAILDVTKVN